MLKQRQYSLSRNVYLSLTEYCAATKKYDYYTKTIYFIIFLTSFSGSEVEATVMVTPGIEII